MTFNAQQWKLYCLYMDKSRITIINLNICLLQQSNSNIFSGNWMKNFAMTLLAALLISLTLVKTSVQASVLDIVGPLTTSAFKCLAKDGYTVAIVRAYSLLYGGAIDPNAVSTLKNAKDAGLSTHIYMEMCRNGDSATQIDFLLAAITPPTKLYDRIFIKVQPNSTPGCLWPTTDPIGNCIFLNYAITELRARYIGSGIYSTAAIWKSLFGDDCLTFQSLNVSLWYGYNNVKGKNSSVFVPFGGWKYPTYSQIKRNVTVALCKNSLYHAFLNINEIVGPLL